MVGSLRGTTMGRRRVLGAGLEPRQVGSGFGVVGPFGSGTGFAM